MKKLILSLILVVLSNSLAFANPTQRCEQATEFFTPLAQLVIDNAGTPPIEKLCIHIDKARIYSKIIDNESEVIRQLSIVIRITNNQSPFPITQEAGNSIIAEAQRLIGILQVSNVVLPPDPGEAGKVTVEGIISPNSGGLRDDLVRFIALKYPDSETIRVMLTLVAKSTQAMLVDAYNETLSVQHMEEAVLLANCSDHISWKKNIDLREWFDMEKEIKAEVINTDLRVRHYIRFNQQGGRRTYSGGPDYGSEAAKRHCPFDPDILPN